MNKNEKNFKLLENKFKKKRNNREDYLDLKKIV